MDMKAPIHIHQLHGQQLESDTDPVNNQSVTQEMGRTMSPIRLWECDHYGSEPMNILDASRMDPCIASITQAMGNAHVTGT